MMRASLLVPPSFMDVLKACILMIITLMSVLCEYASSSFSRLLL